MKDLICGCFNNYRPESLALIVNSIEMSGFTGDKLAFIYGNGQNENDSAAYLLSKGWIVERKDQFTKLIVVCRFREMANYLASHLGKYRYIISVDMGDVYFQSNPTDFLNVHMPVGKHILVGSEGLYYKDETAWGRDNMLQSFPEYGPHMMNEIIMNAGTVAADAVIAIPLFTRVFEMSMLSPVGNPDQAALNIVLRRDFPTETFFSTMKDGWAIQFGTIGPNKHSYFGHALLERNYSIKDGYVYNEVGNKFCIVHQYNWMPGMFDQIKGNYNVK